MNTMETVQFDEAMFAIRKLLLLHEQEPYNKDDALFRFAQIGAYASRVFLNTLEPVVPKALLVPTEQIRNLYNFVEGYSDTSDLSVFINTTDVEISNLSNIPRAPRSEFPKYPYEVNVVAMRGSKLVVFGNLMYSGEKIRDYILRETNKKYAHLTDKFPDLVNNALSSSFFNNLMS